MNLQVSAIPGFLRGESDMAARIRAFDWSATPLGDPRTWPSSLRTTVSTVLNAPVPMALLWGPDGILLYNDGYAAIAGSRHPEILGAPVLDAWPEAAAWNAEVLQVVLAGGRLSYKDQEFVLVRDGRPEQVWMSLDYGPVTDEDGRPVGVLAVCAETTQRVVADRRTAEEHDRLRRMFAQAPSFMAVLSGPEHRFEIVNASYMQLVGHRADLLGRTVREALPEIEGQGYFELLDDVLGSGRTFTGRNLAVNLQREPGMPAEKRFVDLVYQPLLDSSGIATGIFVEGFDVTERVLASERQELLLREMNHRVKNLFAIVIGMVASTARRAATPADMAAALKGRLEALAAAHSLIRPASGADGTGPVQAGLAALVRSVVGPLVDDPARLVTSGPAVALGEQATTAFALLLHETATNAVKYGALSTPAGTVRLDWRSDGGALHLDWSEQGGPPPREPGLLGFGSLLVQRSVEGQLQGSLRRTWRPEGLLKQVSVPIAVLSC